MSASMPNPQMSSPARHPKTHSLKMLYETSAYVLKYP